MIHPVQGRSVLARLGSLRLALWLLALFTLMSLFGVLLPQAHLLSQTTLEQWQVAHPRITTLAHPLGLFHVFSSVGFLALIALLALNTAACTVHRLQQRGGVQAFRGRDGLRNAGFTIVHLSLLGLMAGGILSAGLSMNGRMLLVEGHARPEVHAAYRRIHEGPLRKDRHRGWTIHLEDLHLRYTRNGPPLEIAATVQLLDGDQLLVEGVIEVNRPLRYQGLSITLDETGYVPHLSMTAPNGRHTETQVVLQTERLGQGRIFHDVLHFPPNDTEVVMTLYPDHAIVHGKIRKTGDNPVRPLLIFSSSASSEVPTPPKTLAPNQQTEILGYRIHFTELSRWASFAVSEDPGYPLVAVSLWISLLGLGVRYLPDVWYTDPHRGTGKIAGFNEGARHECRSG